MRSLSNDDANDIRITAAGDVFVRSVVAGLYAADASQAPVVLNSAGAVVANTSLSSQGDVFLTSTAGRVLETFVDTDVDLVADVLTIEAALGITGLEMALNTLDVRTTSGDITLFEVDGYLEKSKGLDVLRAVITTPTAGADDVSLTVQGELRVGRVAVSGGAGYSGLIKGDAIRLESQNDSVSVLRPATGEALVYTRGIGFAAFDAVQLYRFFAAPERLEYRAGTYIQFGEGTNENPYSRKLPTVLSADTLILESGGTLTLDGSLSANRLLELVAGEDLVLKGTISLKGTRYDGTQDTDSKIDEVVLTASGVRNASKAFDFTGDGDTNDTVTEAKAGIDFNLDGDFADSINEGSVPSLTGFVNIQTNDLPAEDFEIRARRDIFIDLNDTTTGVVRNWSLSGFIGGLSGFDSAQNVTLRVEGALSVKGGIVSASSTGGQLSLKAASISSDGASVFIADNLVVDTLGSAQLNTLVTRLTLDSRVAGNVSINEATGLDIDSLVANDGSIEVTSGGDMRVRDVRNTADGDSITLKSGNDLFIDSIEAGTAVGALKTGGTVVVDAKGRVYEWAAVQQVFAQNTTLTSAASGTSQSSRLSFDAPARVIATQVAAASVKQITGLSFEQRELTVGDEYAVTVNGSTISSTVQAGTTWTSLLNALKSQIDNGPTAATVVVGARQLVLTADNNNQSFTATGAVTFALAAGDEVSVQIDSRRYAVTATAGAGWSTLLSSLATKVQAGETGAFAKTVTAGATTLTVTANANNQAFQAASNLNYSALDQQSAELFGWRVEVRDGSFSSGTNNIALAPLVLSDPTVRGTGLELEVRTIAANGLSKATTSVTQTGAFATGTGVQSNNQTLTTAAGSLTTQVSTVNFPGELGLGYEYQLSITSDVLRTYKVEPGKDALATDAGWAAVLGKFKTLIELTSPVNVSLDAELRQLQCRSY